MTDQLILCDEIIECGADMAQALQDLMNRRSGGRVR